MVYVWDAMCQAAGIMSPSIYIYKLISRSETNINTNKQKSFLHVKMCHVQFMLQSFQRSWFNLLWFVVVVMFCPY